MADDALAGFAGRMHQLFPVLTEPEIARVSRFGTVHIYPRGTRLFSAGERAPGMFVVLKGILAISQRSYVTLWRQPVLMVSTMLFPVVYLLILGNALNHQLRAIPIASARNTATMETR